MILIFKTDFKVGFSVSQCVCGTRKLIKFSTIAPIQRPLKTQFLHINTQRSNNRKIYWQWRCVPTCTPHLHTSSSAPGASTPRSIGQVGFGSRFRWKRSNVLTERSDTPGRQVHAVHAVRSESRGSPGRWQRSRETDRVLRLQRQLWLCTNTREGLLGECRRQPVLSEPLNLRPRCFIIQLEDGLL